MSNGQAPNILYWPSLDIDLAVDSLDHPERYPLVSRASSPARRVQPAARTKRKRRGSEFQEEA